MASHLGWLNNVSQMYPGPNLWSLCVSPYMGKDSTTEEKAMRRWSRERLEDAVFENWRDEATSQGMLVAIRNWKR